MHPRLRVPSGRAYCRLPALRLLQQLLAQALEGAPHTAVDDGIVHADDYAAQNGGIDLDREIHVRSRALREALYQLLALILRRLQRKGCFGSDQSPRGIGELLDLQPYQAKNVFAPLIYQQAQEGERERVDEGARSVLIRSRFFPVGTTLLLHI